MEKLKVSTPKTKLPLNLSSLKYNYYSNWSPYGDILYFSEIITNPSTPPSVYQLQIIKPNGEVYYSFQKDFTGYFSKLYEKKADHENVLKILLFKDTVLNTRQIKQISKLLPSKFESDLELSYFSNFIPENSTFLPCIVLKTEETGMTLNYWISTNGPMEKLQLAKNPQILMQLLKLQVGIVQGLLAGLKYLHQVLDFVHGSVSPENLILVPGQNLPVKLTFIKRRDYSYGNGELLWREGTKEGDIFAGGVCILQILQLLSSPIENYSAGNSKPNYYAVQDHALIANAEKLIMGMAPILRKDGEKRQVFAKIEDVKVQVKSSKEIQSSFQHNAPSKVEGENETILKVASLFEDPQGHAWLRHLQLQGPVLGKGSFGVVIKAFDSSLQRYSAVKILNVNLFESSCGSGGDKVDAELEFKNMQNCYHRNLMKLYQMKEVICSGTLLKRTLIEMELCGQNLRTWLNDAEKASKIKGSANLNLFQLQISQDLIEGMTYLHKQDVIHRDLKPENIFFANTYDEDDAKFYILPMKIGDFGLSRQLIEFEMVQQLQSKPEVLNSSTSGQFNLTQKRGTPLYRAPEVKLGIYGKQADIFSLGLIFWEIMQDLSKADRSEIFKNATKPNGEESLVKEHPLISNAKQVILSMTQWDTEKRIKRIQNVKLICGGEERILHVTNSDEFTTVLKTCCEDSTIFLHKGEYIAPFILKRRRVTIEGEVKTEFSEADDSLLVTLKMHPDLENFSELFSLQSYYCTLKNLRFFRTRGNWEGSSSRCVLALHDGSCNLENISISGGSTGLRMIGGTYASISNVLIQDCSVSGIIVGGDHHSLENVVVKDTVTGICVASKSSALTFNNIKVEGVMFGMDISGHHHKINGLVISKCDNLSTGVMIWSVQDVSIDNAQIDCPFLVEKKGLVFSSRAENVVVSDSMFCSVYLDGVSNTLRNVDSKDLLRISGIDHVVDGCQGQVVQTYECYDTMVNDECAFDKEIHQEKDVYKYDP